MFKIENKLCLSLLILLGYAQSQAVPEINERILGGTNITISQAPYQVVILYTTNARDYVPIATGSILSERHVLTSAIGLYLPAANGGGVQLADAQNLRIQSGVHSLIQEVTIYTTIDRVKVHESFNNQTLENNLAVLRITGKFTFSNNVDKIQWRTTETPMAEECRISGWGSHVPNGNNMSTVLMQANVKIYNHTNCKLISEFIEVTDRHICAGDIEAAPCQNDRGTPLVCGTPNQLAGILSSHMGCGQPNPAVFTELAKYNAWLQVESSGFSNRSSIIAIIISLAVSLLYSR